MLAANSGAPTSQLDEPEAASIEGTSPTQKTGGCVFDTDCGTLPVQTAAAPAEPLSRAGRPAAAQMSDSDQFAFKPNRRAARLNRTTSCAFALDAAALSDSAVL